jgi:hypothetical protein
VKNRRGVEKEWSGDREILNSRCGVVAEEERAEGKKRREGRVGGSE